MGDETARDDAAHDDQSREVLEAVNLFSPPVSPVISRSGRFAACLVVSMCTHVKARDDHVPCVQSGIDEQRSTKRAREEAGRDQQHERHRELHDDEHAAGPSAATGCQCRESMQPGNKIDPRRLQCRREPGGDSGPRS